ncbi:chromophore lyase CpcT/CpeT [uncultured Aquimarina sp.]|uniref:chromophore lyase CpcT/CpeT n=1 Tax=uncultured Aquimarina sp. TaxID=575652 RepID=UPI00260B8A42|nr:chromophore lyase CpcT/CpeT [uncultured Aquimarina sp.]
MQRSLLLLGLLITTISCSNKIEQGSQIDDLTGILSGKFSSKKQAKEESGYSAVCLINIPIWDDRPGYWFYQELYDEKNSTSIYNQRIINFKKLDSLTISSVNYSIPDQKRYANGWKDISIFDHLTIDSLKIRDGCDVYFKKKTSTIYHGKTKKGTCSSSFSSKISYTTSNIVISKNKITSWDRGYNTQGKQIWGKIQGPYKFIRVRED